MKRIRDILMLLTVAVAFGFSLVLFQRAVGLASPWFALLLMLDFLGLIAFARPLLVLRLPGWLRSPHEWELQGRLYKILHVPSFGALLRRTPLRHLNPLVYLSQDSDRSQVQAQIESAEAAHLFAAALILPYMAYAVYQGWWTAVLWLTAIQIGFNLYPIMHLRWVRARLNRLSTRIIAGNRADICKSRVYL